MSLLSIGLLSLEIISQSMENNRERKEQKKKRIPTFHKNFPSFPLPSSAKEE